MAGCKCNSSLVSGSMRTWCCCNLLEADCMIRSYTLADEHTPQGPGTGSSAAVSCYFSGQIRPQFVLQVDTGLTTCTLSNPCECCTAAEPLGIASSIIVGPTSCCCIGSVTFPTFRARIFQRSAGCAGATISLCKPGTIQICMARQFCTAAEAASGRSMPWQLRDSLSLVRPGHLASGYVIGAPGSIQTF